MQRPSRSRRRGQDRRAWQQELKQQLGSIRFQLDRIPEPRDRLRRLEDLWRAGRVHETNFNTLHAGIRQRINRRPKAVGLRQRLDAFEADTQ